MMVIGAKWGILIHILLTSHKQMLQGLSFFSEWSVGFDRMGVCQKVKVIWGENKIGLGKQTRAVLDECRNNFVNHL
jgi:hypothetical protein